MELRITVPPLGRALPRRLYFMILLALLALLPSPAGATPKNKLTLTIDGAEFKAALQLIERQSPFRFRYSEGLLSGQPPVTLRARDADLFTVLDGLLAGRGIRYRLLGHNGVALEPARVDRTISGRVTSSSGQPLAGVSVTAPGNRGTTTDADGRYSLNVPDDATTLVFSYVGYQSQTVSIAGRTEVNVTLTAAENTLEQVVVVGYGTQRRRDVTGSVGSVSGTTLARQQVQTPSEALQGQVAGVQVLTSGEPNSAPQIRIRGVGTMLGGAEPLYVVDGIITDDIRNINSADIQSMEILKDASAAAIYGVRAANGVVLITTRRGRTGPTVYNFDATVGVREASHLVNMAGSQQYAGYLNEASIYYGSGDSAVRAAQLAGGYNTDWYDAILRKGLWMNYNFSLSGGSEAVTYFLSAGYLDQEGILKDSRFRRFTLRSNNDFRLSSIFRLGTNISYAFGRADNSFNSAFTNAYRAAPIVPSVVDGKYGNTSAVGNVANPLLDIDKRSDRTNGHRLQGVGSLEAKPVTWLTLRTAINADLQFFNSRVFLFPYFNEGPQNVFLTVGGNQQRTVSNLSIDRNQSLRWVWDNTFTIQKAFDKHNFTLLGGVTAESFTSTLFSGTRDSIPLAENQWFLSAGQGSRQTNPTNTGDKFTRNSYIGRLSYNYNERYLATLTFRADASSKFPTSQRWAYSPSIGVGWNIGNEDFMGKQKIFSTLKLRGSYGKLGNDNIPSNAFRSLASGGLNYVFGTTVVPGTAFTTLSDPNLKWETTREGNIGLDFAVLKNRLNGTIEVYNRKTEDALVNVNILGSLGYTGTFLTNAASFTNKGVEFTLNWSDKAGKDWTYSIGGNLAFNKNRIVGLGSGQPLFAGAVNSGFTTYSANGQPIGAFYLYETDGLFATDAEAAASGQAGGPRAGDLRIVDQDKSGAIDDKDRVFMGSAQPTVTYGVNLTAGYKNFDLTMNSYGSGGNKIFNAKKAVQGASAFDNRETADVENRWTPDRPNTNVPRARLEQQPYLSDYFLESGNFFRINNLTLGYTLGRAFNQRTGITKLRVFVSVQNLATFTNYSGFTPEILPPASNSTLNAGVDLNTYPSTRTWSIGVNLGF